MTAMIRLGGKLVLLVAVIAHLACGDVQGPEPPYRLYNHVDCPPHWFHMPGAPIGPTCPPGYRRPWTPPHGRPPRPCRPWADSSGNCHVSDDVKDRDECIEEYGEEDYAIFQDNYYQTRPPGPPGPPAPPCMPIEP